MSQWAELSVTPASRLCVFQASPPQQEEVRGQTAVRAAGGSFSAEAAEGRRPQPHLQPGDLFYPGLSQGDTTHTPTQLLTPTAILSCDMLLY